MKPLRLQHILAETNSVLIQGNGRFRVRHVVTNPRLLKNDTLLFDLSHNCHLYRNKLKSDRYVMIMTEHPERYAKWPRTVAIIQTPSISGAYWKFIRFYRNLFSIPVIGVTGTCGKTTTKEMIAHIMAKDHNVVATYKSKNSLERNLSYLLSIDDQTEVAVFEMGVAAPHDLPRSCAHFQPTIGIITTIGIDHLQHCGSLENYIKEKAKLLTGIKKGGVLLLNRDDDNIKKINTSRFSGKIVYFGIKDEADFKADQVRFTKAGMAFTLQFQGEVHAVVVPGHGEHNVYNALAAIAASYFAGLTVKQAAERLSSFQQLERHLQMYPGVNGSTVIDDTWSSNPTSAEAAIKVLKQVADGKKTVAILGKMGLLGKHSRLQHSKIGEKVVDHGIDVLITLDDTAKQIGVRASQLGMKNIYNCREPQQVQRILRRILDKDTYVLVKTSMLDASYKVIRKTIIHRNKG